MTATAEIRTLGDAQNYAARMTTYLKQVTGKTEVYLTELDQLARDLAAELADSEQAVVSLTGHGTAGTATAQLAAANEQLSQMQKNTQAAHDALKPMLEATTRAAAAYTTAKAAFTAQAGISEHIAAQKATGNGVAANTSFYSGTGTPAPATRTPAASTAAPDTTPAGEPMTTSDYPAPTRKALETGPYSRHKLPNAAEDKQLRDMVAAQFDPMRDVDPRPLKALLDNAPDDKRDAWRRRADEIAHAWGASLPYLFQYIEPERGPEQPATTTPSPEPEQPAPAAEATAPVTGRLSDKPLRDNTWGVGPREGAVIYHPDGPIGTAIEFMGPDARMVEVDGQPLANVLGQVATDVVRGRRTAQEGVNALKTLHGRLPEGSLAKFKVGRAIEDMDAPPSPPPAVPDGTPKPLRDLVATLNEFPIVRKDPSKELTPLLTLIDRFVNDEIGSMALLMDLRGQVRNKRHESLSDCGKLQIDHAVDAAVEELEAMRRDKTLTPPTTRRKR